MQPIPSLSQENLLTTEQATYLADIQRRIMNDPAALIALVQTAEQGQTAQQQAAQAQQAPTATPATPASTAPQIDLQELARLLQMPRESKVSKKYPDPPAFTGEQKEVWTFILQLRAKISANRDWWATEEDKVYYAFSRLEGVAVHRMGCYFDGRSERQIRTIEDFYKILETTFGDPDPRKTAREKVQLLKQKNQPFLVWFPEFDSYAARSEYTEDTLRDHFLNNLSSELSAALVYDRPPKEGYQATVTHVQQLDDRMQAHARRSLFRSRNPAKPGQAQQLQKPQNAFGSLPASKALAPRASGPPAASSRPSGDPMEIDTITQRGPHPKLTQEEKDRRQREGLCRRCAQPGHFARDCPIGQRQQTTMNAITAPATQLAITDGSENDQSLS